MIGKILRKFTTLKDINEVTNSQILICTQSVKGSAGPYTGGQGVCLLDGTSTNVTMIGRIGID